LTSNNSASAAAAAAVSNVVEIPYPSDTANLHYEIELVVALHKGGSNIGPSAAHEHVYGCAVGVDLTRRDLQAAAKKMGRPWCAAKGFDRSAPISHIRRLEQQLFDPDATLWLDVNGERRQTGQPGRQMIWDVPHIISSLSQSFELQAGDLIFTGTPAGVGALQKGDLVTAGMEGVGDLAFTVT